MPKQIKNSKLIENLDSMMPTGYNKSAESIASKSSHAMAQCTSVTKNSSMCMCTMDSVRSGLPSKSKDNANFMCDSLDM